MAWYKQDDPPMGHMRDIHLPVDRNWHPPRPLRTCPDDRVEREKLLLLPHVLVDRPSNSLYVASLVLDVCSSTQSISARVVEGLVQYQ